MQLQLGPYSWVSDMVTNRYVTRRITSVAYKLKRLYGGTIFVYKQGNPATNIQTGVTTWPNREVTRIERAIILPVKLDRDQPQGISYISSGKEFVYGGMVDKKSRWFYIDPSDLANGYVINRDDWITYEGKKYEIKEINDIEFNALWEVLGVEIPGVVPEEIHLLSGHTIIDVSHTNARVVE